MQGLFGGSPSAPYPTTGYPASAFFGATSLQPAVGGTNQSAPANPTDTRTFLIVVGVAVIGGYIIFHLYNR